MGQRLRKRSSGGGLNPRELLHRIWDWEFHIHIFEAVTDPERRSRLYRGLPAFVVMVAALGVLFYAWRQSKGRTGWYRKQAMIAEHEGDYERIKLCYDRVIDLGGSADQARFRLAKAAFARGDRKEALRILNILAPADRKGYGPAHLWLGQLFGSGRMRHPTMLRTGEVHFKRALEASHRPEQAHAGLMEIYAKRREFLTGEPHLIEALRLKAVPRTDALLYYARWIGSLDSEDDRERERLVNLGKKHAALVEQEARARLKAAPMDDRARFELVAAHQFRNDFAGSVELLEAGSKLRPGAYAPALASSYFHWAVSLGTAEDRRALRTDLLLKSFELNPFYTGVVMELYRLEGEDAKRWQAAIDAQMAIPDRAPHLHHILGAALLLLERPDEAFPHIKKAHEYFGLRSPENANNLALAYATKSKPDAVRGLALIDRVMAKNKSLLFLDTRGRILVVLKRWSEALNDLERALGAVQDKAGTMRQMALAYEGMGNSGMAERFRKRARRAEEERKARRQRLDSGQFAKQGD